MNLAYSSRNRSAAIRIPTYSPSPKARRLEVRFPDPTCNPYLAFSAMMMAGLDGIQNKIDPGDPLDKDIYALSPEELKTCRACRPRSKKRSTPRARPRVPAQGRRLHARRDRDVARLQARARGAGDAPAPDAARVLPLLRHLRDQS